LNSPNREAERRHGSREMQSKGAITRSDRPPASPEIYRFKSRKIADEEDSPAIKRFSEATRKRRRDVVAASTPVPDALARRSADQSR
jgi:hypothetical protein